MNLRSQLAASCFYLLDCLAPRRCLACSELLAHPLQRAADNRLAAFLCPACRERLYLSPPVIPPPGSSLDWVCSAYLYAGLLEQLLPVWKYHRGYHLFPFFAVLVEMAAAELAKMLSVRPAPSELVTAVPLDARRFRQRGFNQSFFIASRLGRSLGLPTVGNLLEKRIPTRRQAALARRQRLTNLRPEHFSVLASARVRGRHILLCDDVMTTGTTLAAVAGSLKTAGAATVAAFTLARVA